MQIAGMDSMDGIADDSKALIFDYADFESKIYLALTSKIFTKSYEKFFEKLTLNEYIDGLYLFSSSEKKLAAWVNKKDMYKVQLINYNAYRYTDRGGGIDKWHYLQQKQVLLKKNEIILGSINEVIKDNEKTKLKFDIHRHDIKLAIALFSQNYTEERHRDVLNNICSFFNEQSSLKNFKTIENKINDKELAIDEKIINKALTDNNFSVLVFLLHNLYRIYPHTLPDGVVSIFDTATHDKKMLLMQAGYDVNSLIKSFQQAVNRNKIESEIDHNRTENVKSLFTIILDSENLGSCPIEDVYSCIFKFKFYDLILKLFEKSYFSSTKCKLDTDQIHIIIKTCYDHYGKDLWKNERAICFFDFVLSFEGYDQALLNYLSSIVDTLPYSDYHNILRQKVLSDRNGQSFGKKMEFLFSKGIDIMSFRVPLLYYWCEYEYEQEDKDKDYRNSDMCYIMETISEDIIIKLIQEKKQSLNQGLDVSFIQDLFNCAVIEKKWKIVSLLLPDVTIERIGSAPVDYVTLLKELVEHCPDQMLAFIKKHMTDGVFFRCGYRDFFATILSSAIDLKQLDIVKFLLLHDKVNLLNGSCVDLDIFNPLMDNACAEVIQNCKKWDHSASLLSRVKSRYLHDIVVSLQQDQLINIEQVFQWHEEGKFSNWRSEELINIVLNNQGLNDDKAKELLLNVINKRQLRFLEWLLKRKEINIVKHAPDRLIEIFERCDKRSIVNHVAQANFTYDERKEFLYRTGIWKTADVIFCMWWYSISNLKKTLIYCGSLAILASIVVGLCYQLTPINLIV